MKRQKHNLSNYNLTTTDMGKLVPVQCIEILPGDSMQLESSALIRVSPMLAPVMHPCQVRFHHWFVPNRLVWDGWEDFITGGKDNQNADTPPTVTTDGTAGNLLDHMGIPTTTGIEVNAMPIRAYNLIFNEFYRDQDLVDEVDEDNLDVLNVAWRKDYFTTARPWQQKGADLVLPIGDRAPIVSHGTKSIVDNTYAPTGYNATVVPQPDPEDGLIHWEDKGAQGAGIYADLANATGISAVDFREFFALQRYAEARAKYGSRYTEYLQYLGIRPSDARLQRPEYLGGGKQNLQFSEVLTTYDNVTDDVPAGTMRGHGITALKTRRTKKFFEEHGHVITMMSVVPKSIYTNGVERNFFRKDKEDYFQRELQSIGQQPVLNGEVYADGTTADRETFGYSDRYSEYTWKASNVTGEFRNLLNYWHMGREFQTRPALNETFIKCVPTKRVHAEQTQNSLWCMINNKVSARRMVKNVSIGRLM